MMKLLRSIFMFLMVCVVFPPLHIVNAQEDFDDVSAMYDEDAAFFDEMMAFYLDEGYDSWEDDEESLQAAAPSAFAPYPPRITSVYHSGTDQITVFWSRPTTGSEFPRGYDIYVDNVWRTRVANLAADCSCKVGSVAAGTHSVYVVSYNNYGLSKPSNTVSVTVATQSSTPTIVSAVQIGTAVGPNGKVQLDWVYIPGAHSYNIYRSTGGAWTKVWSGVGTYTGTGINVTGVQATVSCPKGTYLFAVTSCNPGESGKSKSKLVEVR